MLHDLVGMFLCLMQASGDKSWAGG